MRLRVHFCTIACALTWASPTPLVNAQAPSEPRTLTPGCYPAAQVRAQLTTEGMQPVVVGNRVTTRPDRPAHYFTSNVHGEGYQIEGDKSFGTPATTMCISARIDGIKLNDIHSPMIPSWALIGNDRSAAERNCRETGAGMCTSHDDYVRNATANGQRVMLVANTVFKNPDGSVRHGRMITVLTQVDTKLADVTATNSVGASESVAGLEKVNYTQFGISMIGR